MAIIQCNECGKGISDKAHLCPHCGVMRGQNGSTAGVNDHDNSSANNSKQRSRTFVGCLGLFAICVIGGAVQEAMLTPEQRERRRAEIAARDAARQAELADRAEKRRAELAGAEIERAEAAARANTVSAISWREIHDVYSLNSEYTDLQKESKWKNFKNRLVEWTGEVVDVDQGMFGGVSMTVKMESTTFTFDLQIHLKPGQTSRASDYSKGDRVRFRGRLKQWGSLLAIVLDEGELVD